ncbi:MAG: restriction endonuclease [Planctomycetes bacterium]|nr:restriction endonuclease [Planctomycetota bacterium]
MAKNERKASQYVMSIRRSGLSIYDVIEASDPELWIPANIVEELLDTWLRGVSLEGLPLRTRSKVVKIKVCEALGYPIPRAFKKTQPRFIGQMLDTYIQKSNNLQIWNEEISPSRRYAIIRVGENNVISKVKVVTGDYISILDTTGTLTQKYQARLILAEKKTELITKRDTSLLQQVVSRKAKFDSNENSTDNPRVGELLPISEIFKRLKSLVGQKFSNISSDQERNRGALLHRLVCAKLGYRDFRDDGKFPDVRHQLLEVKLQTSPTIDLGKFRPDSEEPLCVPTIDECPVRHCDVRYAIFFGTIESDHVTLSRLYVTTGEKFFNRFPQFRGKVRNQKLQIPLPSDFFDL